MKLLYLESVARHAWRFLKKFKELRPSWEVLLVSFNPAMVERLQSDGYKALCLDNGIHHHDDWDRQNSYGWKARLKLRYYFYRNQKKFQACLADFKPDIVMGGWIQTDGLLAATTKVTPLVQVVWGTDILQRPFDNRANWHKTKYVLNRADLIHCDCLHTETQVKSFLHQPTPVVTVARGIDLKSFPTIALNRPFSQPTRIAMIKQFRDIAQVHLLILAIAQLENHHAFEVHLFGEGSEEKRLRSLVQEKIRHTPIHFHGHLPAAELRQAILKNDIYVSCNTSDGPSIALMESAYVGLIPILSPMPSYQERFIDQHNAFYFDGHHAQDLAEKIQQVVGLRAERLTTIRQDNRSLAHTHFNEYKNFETLFTEMAKCRG